eukprot:tig00020553_g10718.t1
MGPRRAAAIAGRRPAIRALLLVLVSASLAAQAAARVTVVATGASMGVANSGWIRLEVTVSQAGTYKFKLNSTVCSKERGRLLTFSVASNVGQSSVETSRSLAGGTNTVTFGSDADGFGRGFWSGACTADPYGVSVTGPDPSTAFVGDALFGIKPVRPNQGTRAYIVVTKSDGIMLDLAGVNDDPPIDQVGMADRPNVSAIGINEWNMIARLPSYEITQESGTPWCFPNTNCDTKNSVDENQCQNDQSNWACTYYINKKSGYYRSPFTCTISRLQPPTDCKIAKPPAPVFQASTAADLSSATMSVGVALKITYDSNLIADDCVDGQGYKECTISTFLASSGTLVKTTTVTAPTTTAPDGSTSWTGFTGLVNVTVAGLNAYTKYRHSAVCVNIAGVVTAPSDMSSDFVTRGASPVVPAPVNILTPTASAGTPGNAGITITYGVGNTGRNPTTGEALVASRTISIVRTSDGASAGTSLTPADFTNSLSSTTASFGFLAQYTTYTVSVSSTNSPALATGGQAGLTGTVSTQITTPASVPNKPSITPGTPNSSGGLTGGITVMPATGASNDGVNGQGYESCNIQLFQSTTLVHDFGAVSTPSANGAITVEVPADKLPLKAYTQYTVSATCKNIAGETSAAQTANFVTLAVKPDAAFRKVGTTQDDYATSAGSGASQATATLWFKTDNAGRDPVTGLNLNAAGVMRVWKGTTEGAAADAIAGDPSSTSFQNSLSGVVATNSPAHNNQNGIASDAAYRNFKTGSADPNAPGISNIVPSSAQGGDLTVSFDLTPASGNGDGVDGKGYNSCEVKLFRKKDDSQVATLTTPSSGSHIASDGAALPLTFSGLLAYTATCTNKDSKTSTVTTSGDFVTLAVAPTGSVTAVTATAGGSARDAGMTITFGVGNTGRDATFGEDLHADLEATVSPAPESGPATQTGSLNSNSGAGLTFAYGGLRRYTLYTITVKATNKPTLVSPTQQGLQWTGAGANTRTGHVDPSTPTLSNPSVTASALSFSVVPASGDSDGVDSHGYSKCSASLSPAPPAPQTATVTISGSPFSFSYTGLNAYTRYHVTATCENVAGGVSPSVTSGTDGYVTKADAPTFADALTTGSSSDASAFTSTAWVGYEISNTGRDTTTGVPLDAASTLVIFKSESLPASGPISGTARSGLWSYTNNKIDTVDFSSLDCWTYYIAQAVSTNSPVAATGGQAGLATTLDGTKFRTPSVKPATPKDVTTSKTSSSVTVGFTPVGVEDGQKKDGVGGAGYSSCTVTLKLDGVNVETKTWTDPASGSALSYTFSGLKPYRTYSYEGSCTNRNSKTSSPVSGTVKTDPNPPQAPVINEGATTETSSSITIGFTPSSTDGVDGQGYNGGKCTVSATAGSTTTTVDASNVVGGTEKTGVQITGLAPWTDYDITVTCCNVADPSDDRSLCASDTYGPVKTEANNPGKPTVDAYCSNADPAAAKVAFLINSETGGAPVTSCLFVITDLVSWTVTGPEGGFVNPVSGKLVTAVPDSATLVPGKEYEAKDRLGPRALAL